MSNTIPTTRIRTSHCFATINGVQPYADEVVIAAIMIVKSWDHPTAVTAEIQRKAHKQIALHMSGY